MILTMALVPMTELMNMPVNDVFRKNDAVMRMCIRFLNVLKYVSA